MQYLQITTGQESNIGVIKLPKLNMIVPKVDSKISKIIQDKLPKMLAEHFDQDATIKSIAIYDRIPLTIEVNVVLTDEHNENNDEELTVYANETWLY